MTHHSQDLFSVQILDLVSKKKEQAAFKLIVDKFNQPIYWHIRRMVLLHDDANDVLQNTYIKVWKNLHTFKGKSKIFTWIYRIATNESITFINKRKKHISIDDIQFIEPETTNQAVLMDAFAIQKKLTLAIASLPAKQRAVFNLKYYEILKYDEISEITNTSVGALKASYHLAVKKIETFLKTN